MKIVVNNIAASTGGAMSMLQDFYNYIKDNDKENEWIFLLGNKYIDEQENIKVITLPEVKNSWINKLKFDFITGKKMIRKLKPDVVFSMQNIITFGLKIPQVVYIHQSIPFQNTKKFSFLKASERKLAIYQYLIGGVIKLSAKKADKVIVQTKWMVEAICKQLKVDKSKVINILPEIDDFDDLKQKSIHNQLSFIYPTSEDVYKNNECIYKACALLNQKGINDFTVQLTIQNNCCYNNIQFLGRIPREQVIGEFNTSTLIFPSYIETVGLPLAEARKMGTIILASNCEFSREILDGYENAYFFDPFKPEELAALIEKVVLGEVKRKSLSSKHQSLNIRNCSWHKIIDVITNI